MKCQKKVEDSDCGIACEICNLWFHTECIGVADELYQIMRTVGGLHWYCDQCNGRVVKLLGDMALLQKRQDDLEDGMNKLVITVHNDYTSLSSKVDLLCKTVENQKKEVELLKSVQTEINIRKEVEELTATFMADVKWTEVVRKEVDVKLKDVSTELQDLQKVVTVTKSRADQEMDRENRRRNIILYKARESNASSYETRVKDDMEFACKFVEYIVNDDVSAGEIVKVMRLGKRNETGDGERPLLVQFENGMMKNLVMQNLKYLKNAPDSMKRLVVSHDLTIVEREECKKLVSEAKEKEAADQSGEYYYRVRGSPGLMKIVKWKRH